MGAITATSMIGSGDRVITVTTLGVSDNFTFNAAKTPVLILNNITASPLTPLIDGDAGTNVPCPGVGKVDVSGGFSFNTIPAGETSAIPLNSISAFLSGAITITNADGIKAQLLEF